MTPREFLRLVATTSSAVIGAGTSDLYRPGLARPGNPSIAVKRLTAYVRAYPTDAVGYRTLAVAHLNAGRRILAARCLETATDLWLRQRQATPTLAGALRTCLELKLVALILVCLDQRRLRQGRDVRRFLIEVLLVW